MKRVLMLVGPDFEDSEMKAPLDAVRGAGAMVDVAAPEANKVYRGKKNKETITSNMALSDVLPESYDLLVIPGGYSPDHLRTLKPALDICRAFFQRQKPVAAICHGPQLLISADLLRGRTLTCWTSIVIDVQNAGGHYRDEALVVDGNLITSRSPKDLQPFCGAIVSILQGGKVTA